MSLFGYDTDEAICGELVEENKRLTEENKRLRAIIEAIEELIRRYERDGKERLSDR